MTENNQEGQRERCEEARFVDKNSAKLIQRVTSVMPIADELHSKGMIHDENYAAIKAKKTDQDKMRKLFELLTSECLKKAFYYLLEKNENTSSKNWVVLAGNASLLILNAQYHVKDEHL
ncbi:NACHT, LRR and PYD domains-containing protein 1b allele 3 isoform X2 [Onychostoma macrolepis]|uniref:NACHT, LRR and PYD domains-containing protein 1b allele 3 isoform X2 n=1 Tax=Onychostoma macrolepis TaxID=369639 RepID=UPI00272CFADE|nr:NACHT, LRR and PYD domains-containing protein 1b allele 3 isoform X2 [Onychostoma macrolepis]